MTHCDIAADAWVLVVSWKKQRLTVWKDGRPIKSYRVSTSRRGVGQLMGSFKTPTGWHRVVRWIGDRRPPGAVFRSRRFTGEVLPPRCWRGAEGHDMMLTRILRLRGLEPGHNAGPGCDSYARFIYIHGTNHEHLLGRPASHGCIRMGNRDIIDLFERTRGRPTYCLIQEGVECSIPNRRAWRGKPRSKTERPSRVALAST